MNKNTFLLIATIVTSHGIYASENTSRKNFLELQKIIRFCKNQNKFTTLSDGTVVIDTSEYQAKLIYEISNDSHTIELFKINSKPFTLSEKIDVTDKNQLESCVLNKPGREYMIKVSDKNGKMHKGYFKDEPDKNQSSAYISIAIQKLTVKH